MSFESTIVYKSGGPYPRAGGTYNYKGVHSQEALEAALADGWHLTLADAIAPPQKPNAEPADNAPPTRAELEQKANELGLEYDGRTTDRRLAERIAEALKG